MDSRPWLYQDRSFSSSELKYVQSTFAESYAAAIQSYGSLDFLKVYGASGRMVDKTFNQFSDDVEKCRRELLHLYPQAEVIVTIDGNTYENLVTMTAALLGGFILAPFNFNESLERIQAKIEQISQPCAILHGSKSKNFPMSSKEMAILETLMPEIQSKKRPEGQAFIFVFTSGSTGYSKIVEQTETGILCNVDALIELHGLTRRKTIATPLPVFHVNALEFSFFCSLLSGQRLIVYEGFQFFQILDSLEKDRVQIFSVVPHILKSLKDLAKKIPEDKIALEYCVTAASSLSPDLAKSLVETFSFKIIQGYGLSEAVNFSLKTPPTLSREQIRHWLCDYQRPSVGVPLRGNDVFVLDPEGNPLGPDTEGEIAIRGFNVMKGYKGQDNQAIFENGYLHTGDRGFFILCQETGLQFFFITGRQKDVVKRFGLTVSLVEIDDALLKWAPPGVSAIAVSFENESAGEELGVVVHGKADLNSLQNFLEQHLPAYMRPRVILTTERNLRTDSGKPQRWSFASLFKKFQKTIFTERVLIEP